jgi:hypothetical protein
MKRNSEPLGQQVPAQQTTIDQQVPQYKKTLYERLHEMFSKSTEGGDPTKTLQAPFIKPSEQATPTADAMGLPYDPSGGLNTNTDLAEPHRDEDQVGDWLTNKVSEILDTPGNGQKGWDRHVESLTPLMTKSAIESYVNFMNESNILGTLTANSLQIHAFVEQKPLLLNKGVVDGRYRWLYEVQATLSKLPGTIKDYEKIEVGKTTNYRYLIRIQVGRMQEADATTGIDAQAQADDDSDDPNAGLVIESWDIRKNYDGSNQD